MHTIQADEFQQHCLTLMEQVARTGEGLLIIQNGIPMVELRPPTNSSKPSPFGMHQGQIQIIGDILSPVEVDWDAMK
ncbi:MAG: type II toxin-antitoxin system Phd/YefM family antitoxin [Halothiobacillaceae bacterium]